MVIGTSKGELFQDLFEARSKGFKLEADENVIDPDAPEPGMFSKNPDRSTLDRNEMQPRTYQNNKASESPDNIYDDSGQILDSSTPEQRQKLYDKNNPFETGPNIEDRTKDSLGKTVTDIVKGQLTQQKLDDVMSYPLDSSYDRAMKLNADEYFKGNSIISPLATELGYENIGISHEPEELDEEWKNAPLNPSIDIEKKTMFHPISENVPVLPPQAPLAPLSPYERYNVHAGKGKDPGPYPEKK
jgi:hypothetical protein